VIEGVKKKATKSNRASAQLRPEAGLKEEKKKKQR